MALNFLDVVGSRTGALLPTGKACETIEGSEVSCVDVAMPMVIGRAGDFGVTGYETPSELDANASLLKQIETVRLLPLPQELRNQQAKGDAGTRV